MELFQDLRTATVILRGRMRMLLNAALHFGAQRRGLTGCALTFMLGVMYAGFAYAGDFFGVAKPGPAAVYGAVGGALTLLAGFTAITSVTFAISSLYFARDLDFLHSLPVRPRVIVLSRMLSQLALGAGLGVVIAGPEVAAFLTARGALWALPLILLAILAMVAVPLALATAVTIIALRVVPARFARDAGGLFVTLVVVGVAAFNLAIRGPAALAKASVAGLHLPQKPDAWVEFPASPLHWTARAILGYSSGAFAGASAWTLLLCALAAFVVMTVAAGLGGSYLRGFQNAAAASRGRRTTAARALGVSRRPGSVWRLLAAKDLREIRRDASQLGQLLLPMVLFALYIGAPGHGADFAANRLPAWYGTSLTAAFASMFAASGVALRGIGMEGARLWILRSAPVSSRSLLLGKYAVGLAVALAMALALLWIGVVHSWNGLSGTPWDSLRIAVIVAGLVGLATGMGAVWPRLDWTDPRRAVGIGTTLLFLALGSLYLCVIFVVLGLPYLFPDTTAILVWVCDLAVFAMAALTAVVSLSAGAKRLAAMQI